MSKTGKSAVVLLSGGQDSTTCLYWAKKHFEKVYAIGFRYGQRHEFEVELAQKIAEQADVPYVIHEIQTLKKLSRNSLTNSDIAMDAEKPADSLPNTFVPGRNMIFLNYAAVYAYSLGVHNIVTGVSQADYSGYPDCRNTFIKSVNASLNLAMDYEFEIHTPLMWRDKEAVWQLADELGVFDIVRTQTLTCYNGVPADGCGHCPACTLRAKGLEKYLRKMQK
ncbi:7-cyano-7-deazaguanine synthase [Bacteroidia bacterium]|nr:7-cyano-7-deazaguanine synthase [Bacteroidia bacterium]